MVKSEDCGVTITVSDAGEVYTYQRGISRLRVWKGDLAIAAFVAAEWHGGQWSALYRLSCGDYSHDTIGDAARELRAALGKCGPDVDDESYVQACSALETLAKIETL